jgi:excisionase family DNA binding protein
MNTPNHRQFAALGFSPTDLLTPDQVAAALGLSLRTLAAWRSSRRGTLPWVKVGRLCRYRKTDVLAWLDSRTHSNTEV